MFKVVLYFSVDTDFIDTFGVVGFYLRKLEINTSSRVAMLASLIHLSQGESVPFDQFYQYSLDQTGEKLEASSFKTMISKLHQATGASDLITSDDDGYRCEAQLLQQIKQAKHEFELLTRNLK